LHTLTSASVVQLPLNRSWFLQVNSFAQATPWLHAAIRAYAQYGVVLFAVLLVWSWWTARGRRHLATMAASLWAPVGVLIAVGLNQPLGNWVHEPRPYTTLRHVEVLVSRSSDFSFPSDHAVMAGAAAAGVWLVSRRLGLLTGLAAVLLDFARVYVGAHYPVDVAAGLLFGAAVTLLGYLLVRRLVEPVVATAARTPLRPLLTTSRTSEPANHPAGAVVTGAPLQPAETNRPDEVHGRGTHR
jgi:membrane-associated phospholipid phosphatase